MRICLYRGKDLISQAIELLSGEYSHASVLTDELHMEVIQAVITGVERHILTPQEIAIIDVFIVPLAPNQDVQVRQYLDSAIGKPYAIGDVLRFPFRLPDSAAPGSHYDCSRLVFDAFHCAGVDLLKRLEGYAVSPSMLSWSPLLLAAPPLTAP